MVAVLRRGDGRPLGLSPAARGCSDGDSDRGWLWQLELLPGWDGDEVARAGFCSKLSGVAALHSRWNSYFFFLISSLPGQAVIFWSSFT